MKIDIDSDLVDEIVVLALDNAIKNLKIDISEMKSEIKKRKTIPEYKKVDLADCLIYLQNLQRTKEYFGGNL